MNDRRDDDDYEVGYGRPPVATQFKKGRSGNPAGRRKGSKNLGTLVHDALHEKVVITLNGRKKTVSKIEAAFIQQANRAATGDPKSVKLMLDILVGAEAREAARPASEEIAAQDRRRRNQQVLAALKARLADVGGEDGGED